MRIDYLALDEPSGYAVAAQRCMAALRGAGVDVRWVPFAPGPGWGLGYEPAVAFTDGEVCDLVVAHLTPEYWPAVRSLYPRPPLVGQTVWETDRLPAHWPALVDVAELVLVPTGWNVEVMRRSGVTAPLAVVPHVAPAPRPATAEIWDEIPADALVCYSIAPWTARKSLAGVVRAYQTAFQGRPDTLLVLKTSERDLTTPQRHDRGRAGPGSTAWALARLCGEFERPAPVRLVAGRLTDLEIDALHTRGDCYVSLCRSEGWGLPAFDAAAWGNPVVGTRFGGHLEYLADDSAFLVDQRLVAVDDPAGGGSYTSDQRWAEPSLPHAVELLRRIAADPAEAASRGRLASRRIVERFDAAVVADAFLSATASLP